MHVADLLDEFDGRPAEGIDRPAHLRQPKAGVGDRRPGVGREEELEAPAHAIAIDRGDDGLGKGVVL